MSEQRKTAKLSVGDWVSGKSVNDERIRGYIRDYNSVAGTVTVAVVESDRTESIGRTVYAWETQVKRLPDDALSSPEALRELIDVALAARDEAWFYELTAELIALESQREMIASPA